MTDKLTPVRCGCGGEAEVLKFNKGTWIVMCNKCRTSSENYTSRDKAIIAWNRAMRRAKVDILPNTSEDKGEMPFCPHCGDELEWDE